jgi:hypothetical protein
MNTPRRVFRRGERHESAEVLRAYACAEFSASADVRWRRWRDNRSIEKPAQKEDVMEAVQRGTVGGRTENEAQVSEMKKCAERIWNAISKYVAFDDEAIFKDPNWPYLNK